MLQGGVMTSADLDEAVKLKRREAYEDERKLRIFDSKARSIGLDNAGLEKQITEKRKQENYEKECQRKMEEQSALQQMAVYKQTKEEEKRLKTIAKEIDYFRCRFQKPEMRSEWDLNDPNALRKERPLRSGDDDITLGISSAQVFEGEDMGRQERQVRQRAQQRSWLQQQMQERKAATEARTNAERMIDQGAFSRDQHLGELAYSFDKLRMQTGKDINRFNAELARRKLEEKKKSRKDEEEDNLAEIYNMITSDMLSENPNAGVSSTNPNKKVAYMYRGMTPEESKLFKELQHKHLLERRKHEEDLRIMEKQWEQYAINMDRELCLKELELERKQKDIIKEVGNFNKELAIKQNENRIRNNKILGTNRLSDEFYDQFNKNSR